MEGETATSGGHESTGITRVSKACDPCRGRKTRCDIATQSVCSECLKRDQAGQCTIRDKARPNRPLPAKSATSTTSAPGSSIAPSGRPDVAHRGTKRTAASSSSPQIAPSPPQASASYAMHPPSQAGPSKRVSFPQMGGNTNNGTHANGTGARGSSGVSERYTRPVSGPLMVESLLEEEALRRFDLRLEVGLKPENIFDSVQIQRYDLADIGLTRGDPGAVTQAHHWINTHFRAIHHNTPFLNLQQVLDTASRFFAQPPSLVRSSGFNTNEPEHDDLALLYAILALGSLREQTYDGSTGKYRPFRSSLVLDENTGTSPASTRSATFRFRSTAQCLFRLAQDELDQMDQPSETAVQALFLLHTFISNTSMGRRSRDYVARAIMMAHELSLNRRIPRDLHVNKRVKYDKHSTRRRAMLYLYVYFSDVYLSALDNQPPLIKHQDYDADVFDVVYQTTASSGVDTPSGTPLSGLRAFVDLVTTMGSMLEKLHAGSSGSTTAEVVLQLDGELDELRERLGNQTFDIDLSESTSNDALKRTAVAGSVLRQIHFNWSRIALRAPFLKDPLLRHSSLSICARSAMSILQFHRHVISAGLLNLPWMQLRRVTISIYIVFLAVWAGEIPHSDAETAVNSTLEVLCVIGTRWQSAAQVGSIVVRLATKTGLSHRNPTIGEVSALPEQGSDVLAQLANVATHPVDSLDWTASLPIMDGSVNSTSMADPITQFLDMDTLRLFNAELANFGVNNDTNDTIMGSWQSLHQPPW